LCQSGIRVEVLRRRVEKSVSTMRPKYREPAGMKQEATAHYSL